MRKLLAAPLLGTLLLFTCGCPGDSSGLSSRETPGEYSQTLYTALEKPAAPAASHPAKGKTIPENLLPVYPAQPVHLPIRLGVAQIGETSPPAELIAALREHPDVISSVTEMPFVGDGDKSESSYDRQPQAQPNQIDALRRLGAQLGADYVLLIGGTVDAHNYDTPIEVLDLAIVTQFLVPSHRVEIDAKVSGSLIQAQTGAVVSIASAASSAKKYAPTQFADQTQTQLSLAQRGVLSKELAEDLVSKVRERAGR